VIWDEDGAACREKEVRAGEVPDGVRRDGAEAADDIVVGDVPLAKDEALPEVVRDLVGGDAELGGLANDVGLAASMRPCVISAARAPRETRPRKPTWS
jgi:hypothetical protein